MNSMQIFRYNEKEVRTMEKEDGVWWVLKDVCDVLNIAQPTRVAERLDDDEKGVSEIHTPGGKQTMIVINESGLYNVIMRSDKKEAKAFKRWVTHDVLPAIRKHGGYLTPEKVEEALLNPDTIIQLATSLKEERAARMLAEKKIEEDKPKVLFADSVVASKSSILVGELAKLLKQNGVNMGQNRLFIWLRDNKYLCSRGENYNLPTQYSMERGLFEIKKSTYNQPDGTVRVTKTVKVTGRGQQYFINLFLKSA